ncbi:MFS transporter [Pusillimonas sp. TS35]|uniref:MFS transporter n=1 Tax=Paracandidimonas lactea TaxID=2895524 RepID=UPI00136E40F5|nr:MFS transporter [Paracandidimonas lactea]MYN12847.1 MFS transporter [Pusillimonas sp. TS35]
MSASPLASFRHPAFRALWTATLASNLGGLIQAVAAGWLMTTLTTSADLVALVQAATTLPIMIFSLAAGALADNFNRRNIMLVAQSLMMGVSIALAIFGFAGMLTPWLLLAFTFLIGCGTALHNPSWQASMGDLVPRDDLPGAVSLNSMSYNLMRSIGPAVGGMIVATAGAAAAFATNALSYIPLIRALWRWQPEHAPSTLPRETFGSAMGAGLRYTVMSPNLLKVMFRSFVFGLAAVSVLALLPLVTRDLIQGGAFSYGVVLGCFGAGAIAGALLNNRVREKWQNEAIVRGNFVLSAVSAALLAQSNQLWLSCLVLLPAGACWVMTLSLFNVTVQLSTPRWVVGRALALYQTATFGGMAIGSWIWGLLAEAHGVAGGLTAAAVVLLAGAIIGLRYTLPEFSKLDLDPLDRFNEPVLHLDLRPRSGPIMVTVEYDIAQKNVTAFLRIMAQRRRIRIRDGARQWALLRDLELPTRWIETYHVATWVEYVRHNRRRTKADADNYENLRALHQGEGPPRVRRMIERQTVPVQDDTPIKEHVDVH